MTFSIEKFYGLDNHYNAVEHMLAFIDAARDSKISDAKILEQLEWHMEKIMKKINVMKQAEKMNIDREMK